MLFSFANFFVTSSASDRAQSVISVDRVWPAVAQNAAGSVRQFVGQRDCGLVVWHPAHNSAQPRAKADRIPAVRAHQNDVGGLHQKHPEIAVATLADPAEDCPPTSAEQTRNQTEPSSTISASVKHLALTNCGHDSR